ncbi:MAG: protein translocase SEC61 complex subunit gamma [Nitrososphaerota archaeon]|nr:protein translocase SEC61 complex subunit gamma [Candidatus Bathyarchaeota archaeon]MDW8048767.1 protein translocase SEC61 complex subunit gamma [Nitrososphaerota archaeon]
MPHKLLQTSFSFPFLDLVILLYRRRLLLSVKSLLGMDGSNLGLASFIKACSRLLHLARKPDRNELWQTVKVCVLGITTIGTLGYIIKILASFMMGSIPG